jgi:hypothetical protein
MDASGMKVCCQFVTDFVRKRKETVKCLVNALVVCRFMKVCSCRTQPSEGRETKDYCSGGYDARFCKRKKLKMNTQLLFRPERNK